MDVFVGVDVAFNPKKRLPVVIARWVNQRLIPFDLRALPFHPPRGGGNIAALDSAAVERFAQEAVQYVKAVCHHLNATPIRIALDAPSIPTPEGEPRRRAERALDTKGISCFSTPSASAFEAIKAKVQVHLDAGGAVNRLPHSNQLWMLVGFELFRAFSRLAPCLEVFPQATVHVMGAARIYKMKQGGVDAQLSALSRFTRWPEEGATGDPLREIAMCPRHDALDAYSSAWIAALDNQQRQALGAPPDDVIWVPRIEHIPATQGWTPPSLPEPSQAPDSVKPKAARPKASKEPTEFGRDCPGCGEHYFVRWPYGWDAHAAHRCTGISGADPTERKAEFKTRFLS